MRGIISSCICLCLVHIFLIDAKNARYKRTLVWPKGTAKIQIIAGYGVPVDLHRETLIIGSVMKANYNVPTNVSQYLRPNISYLRRRKRSPSRWDIYSLLSQMFESRGFGGKECILKSICEIARQPLDERGGFYQEILEALFTPSITNEIIHHNSDNEFYAAQMIGKMDGNCEIFNDCHPEFMSFFTL